MQLDVAKENVFFVSFDFPAYFVVSRESKMFDTASHMVGVSKVAFVALFTRGSIGRGAVRRMLREPKTSVVQGGRKIIRSCFNDGTEMIEEYDTITDELLVRKRRSPTALGSEGPWVYEVGVDPRQRVLDRDLIAESASSPVLSRADDMEKITFRVRNLPYDASVFNVSLDFSVKSYGEIVVRTSNKKYFKRIDIPEMVRAGVSLEQSNLSWEHKNNTLLVYYKKHLSMKVQEAMEKKERSAMPSARIKDEGPKCAQQ
jgi:hypothetical protein